MDKHYNCADKGIMYRNSVILTPSLDRLNHIFDALDALIDVEERVCTIDTINTEADWGLFKEEIRIIRGELKNVENHLVSVSDDLKKECYIEG